MWEKLRGVRVEEPRAEPAGILWFAGWDDLHEVPA